MKQYLKIFSQTEINQIIQEVIHYSEVFEGGTMYPEDICEMYSDKGIMPWMLYPAFVDAGKSKYFKIKNYGNVKLAWTPERKALLWQRYWVDKVNDWEIAKEFKSTWQTIKRMRSRFHHEDNDPRWVKFIHITRKGLSSIQDKLKHVDSEFVGSERSDLEKSLKTLDYRESDKELWDKMLQQADPMWSEKAIEAGSEELQSIQKQMGINEVEVTQEESDEMVLKMIKEQLKTTVFSDFVSFSGPVWGGELKMSDTHYVPLGKAFRVLEKEYRELRREYEKVVVMANKPTLYDVIIHAAHEFLPKARIYDKELRKLLTHIDPIELVRLIQNPSYTLVLHLEERKFIFTLSKIDSFNQIGFFYLSHVIDNSAK